MYDLPLQIGSAVYHLAKLRMLQFYYNFIDKYIDRSDFEVCQSIEYLIKPHMRQEYENDKFFFFT